MPDTTILVNILALFNFLLIIFIIIWAQYNINKLQIKINKIHDAQLLRTLGVIEKMLDLEKIKK